jgi:DNA topoisomerase-3
MRLFIAEKPELARAIVDGLGGGERKDGYYDCGADHVVWCIGHLLRLAEPEESDPRYAKWRIDDLPLPLVPWRKVPGEKRKQLDVVLDQIKQADAIVHAGDPDAEGQLLVDEILEYAHWQKPVKRVFINDNTTVLVKKALANLRDNADFAGLSAAALAREVGDQIYGFNLTRLYTVAARKMGYAGKLKVGRVQTPILGLVVRRDRENANHKTAFYYAIKGTFSFGVAFPAVYQNNPAIDSLDDKGRLTDAARAAAIVEAVKGQPAEITDAKTETKETPPPLPFNLQKLQSAAAQLYHLRPDAVKDITQTLRDKHRLITYNRSDCQYLSDEQHANAPEVLEAIGKTNPALAGLIGNADASIKGRVFDSSKVSAHHAIIPTAATADFVNLSQDEQKIYTLIARAYVRQFFPNYVYEQTKIRLVCAGHEFAATSHVPMTQGWKAFDKDATDEDAASDEEVAASLKNLRQKESGKCDSAAVQKCATKPRPLYTMATLLSDLPRAAQYAKDERLKKLLIEKDKGKAGEHGGIGTPATRDEEIAKLLKDGFIEEKKVGKTLSVVSTAAGQEFYDALPDEAKYPDMTALWFEQQRDIEAGKMDIGAFLDGLNKYITDEITRIERDGLPLDVKTYPCPKCGGKLILKSGKNGNFWGCQNYPECKATFDDEDGQPKPRETDDGKTFPCPQCGGDLRLRHGSKGAFWGCSNYPKCKATFEDDGGKPRPKEKATPSELHTCLQCGRALIRRKTRKGDDYWWGCSGFPKCKAFYYDKDGKPDFSAAKNGGKNDGKAKK